uniref:HERV-H LTR-associating protein 2 n=1 Tax=Astyanax mexicanus TaxID=7994 RepID=A0A8B9KXI9_ASTMX
MFTTMFQLIRNLILLGLLELTVGDETVTCFYSKECVLPCQSSYHDVIHWHNGPWIAHSFYNGADQLAHQNASYKGRTALFTDQISTGNISLILRGVRIEDSGKYKCYSSISSHSNEAFVNVNVKAPIQSVDIKFTDKTITCSTNKIYPKQTISWNIDGSPKEENSEDNQHLFSLTSSLPIQPDQKNLSYICYFRSGDGQVTYRASLMQDKTKINSGETATIRCPDSQGETGHFNLILTFDDSSEVLSYNGQTSLPIDKKWKDADVKLTPEGKITLHNLDSAKHAGIYTCERKTAQSRQIMRTSVQFNSDVNIIAIIVGIVCVAVLVIITAVICIKYKVCKGGKGPKVGQNGQRDEMKELNN